MMHPLRLWFVLFTLGSVVECICIWLCLNEYLSFAALSFVHAIFALTVVAIGAIAYERLSLTHAIGLASALSAVLLLCMYLTLPMRLSISSADIPMTCVVIAAAFLLAFVLHTLPMYFEYLAHIHIRWF